MNTTQDSQIAVFIDFENVSRSAVNQFDDFDLGILLKEIQKRGRVTIKKAYGDWSRLGNYRNAVHENAVELVQLFSYAPAQGGKNRADIRLVIDVMECLFHSAHINTIVIVSGDSDFSSVMSKAREYGKYTIGMGVQASTSSLLITACDEFIFYDNLLEEEYKALKSRREEAATPELPVTVPMAAAPVEEPAAPAVPVAPPVVSPVHPPAPPLPAPPVITVTSPPVTVLTRPMSVPPPPLVRPEAEALQYFFEFIKLPVVAPDVRYKLLTDLLATAAVGKSLNQVVNEVKEKYDYNNVYSRLQDIRIVAKLACRAGIFAFGHEEPSLLALIRQVREPDPQRAGRQLDSHLLRIALEANFILTPEGTTKTFFAPIYDRSHSEKLLAELVTQRIAAPHEDAYQLAAPHRLTELLQAKALDPVQYDLQHCEEPTGIVTYAAADALLDRVSEQRKDFTSGAQMGLRGLKMLMQLYQQRERELGVDEFLWRTAEYCSARAGHFFNRHDYVMARQYYLTFLALTQEGELAWEFLRALIPPMLSYYWMTLSHELNFFLESFRDRPTPSKTVIGIISKLDATGRKSFAEMAEDLAAVNAGQLRSLLEQISAEPPSSERNEAHDILKTALDDFMAA